ncbi:hypothetical protein [Pseudomonas sp. RIT-PI-r]|uniref:hypothetical protein n=1 Tax=Pseudomonas sp. RIT-PI-r TaxID=1699620 RepID=UPI0006D6E5F3|nr:hypothetical protein [Pseudomonas sp. RIT-PI-r]KPG99225.1 hypothetical protein AK821_06525 [Pseudomonas sp. RIT-PI-r]
MNQKRTRVPLPHPPPYRPSRVTYWLTLLVVVLMAFAIGASIWMLVDSWITGSITTNNRGPRSTYTLALQPRQFKAEFLKQSIGTVFMVLMGLFGLWIYCKVQEPLATSKGKRTKR